MGAISETPSGPPVPVVAESFAVRIGLTCPLSQLASEICRAYELGPVNSCSLIEVGYEDFNFSLGAGGRMFLAKVFANFRSDDDCLRYVGVMQEAVQAGVATPALYGIGDSILNRIGTANGTFRLCLMDYIDGDNLYRLGYRPNKEEISFLADQAARIAQMPLRPPPVYDSWAIVNFAKEYEQKGRYLTEDDDALVQPLLARFTDLQIETLPHCFVHGDLIATNVLKDRLGALWVVDFAVSNYYPRIQELAVLACNLCFDETAAERSRRNLDVLLSSYQRSVVLTERELKALPHYIQLAHAMHLLEANYERIARRNETPENAYWIAQGRAGLTQRKT